MIRSLTAAMLGALVLAAPLAPAAQADEPGKLVTILTAAEPQTQLMAMVLTMQAAQQGAKAHILLCGPAADIALKDAPASATTPQKPRDMSPQGLMQMIMQKTGTTAEVCAIYLPNAGLDAGALLDGVSAAKPDAMAARLLAADTRIMSF